VADSFLKVQKTAPPLGASTQFDQKRNFGRLGFIREVEEQGLWIEDI